MAELKTLPNDASAKEFLNALTDEVKKRDSFTLLELFTKVTGQKPKMWGFSIIGFGQYHYKSERSTQEGDWPLIAFSPRKQNLTLYIMPGFADSDYQDLLSNLGKHKTSKGCLYINKLTDIDVTILEKLLKQSYEEMEEKYN